MKVLFDTNVILDDLVKREPFWRPSAQLFSHVESETLLGYVCATTLTTIHYLAAKTAGRHQAKELVRKLLRLFDVVPVNRLVLETALTFKGPDFEDAVLIASAYHAGMDSLVTRNPRDFKNSSLPIHAPEELLKILSDAQL